MKTTINSLEIAKITGKRHGNVMRDIRMKIKSTHFESILNSKGKIISYNVSEQGISILPYKSEIKSTQNDSTLKAEIERLKQYYKNKLIDKDKKIKQLEDALLAKQIQNQDIIADNDVLKKRNIYLEKEYNKARKIVSMIRLPNKMLVDRIIELNKTLPNCSKDDARRGMQAFHPDKIKGTSSWFGFFKTKHQELRI